MEAGVLFKNRDATDTAGPGDEVTGGILERPV